jgi:hypothetical protein
MRVLGLRARDGDGWEPGGEGNIWGEVSWQARMFGSVRSMNRLERPGWLGIVSIVGCIVFVRLVQTALHVVRSKDGGVDICPSSRGALASPRKPASAIRSWTSVEIF